MDYKETVVVEATKASPPLTVGAMTLVGVPLSDVVLYITLLYTVLQLYFLLRDKWWRARAATNSKD